MASIRRKLIFRVLLALLLPSLLTAVWISFTKDEGTISILEIQFLNMGVLLPSARITSQLGRHAIEMKICECHDGNHQTYCQVTGPNAFYRINTNGLYFDEMIIYPQDENFFGTLIEVSSEANSPPFWTHRVRSKRHVHNFELGKVALSNFPVYIVDTFSYNGEVVAPFHVQYLYPVINEFVIVESWYTHSGNRKPFLYFLQPNISAQFAPYMDKITYLIVEETPSRPDDFVHLWITDDRDHDSFWREVYLRVVAQRYLQDQATNSSSNITLDRTLVLCVDSDEIFNRNIVASFRDASFYPSPGSTNMDGNYLFSNNQIVRFNLRLFYYNFNWYDQQLWNLAFLTDLRSFLLSNDLLRTRISPAPSDYFVINAGWHLSYFSSIDDIIRKIESFAHREYDLEKYKSKEVIKQVVRLGKDIYQRENMEFLSFDFKSNAKDLPEGWEELQNNLLRLQELD